MKMFSRDKYEFVGVRSFNCQYYYAFRNINELHSEEIVLVKEAKLVFPPNLGYTYFHSEELPDAPEMLAQLSGHTLPRLNHSTVRYQSSLAENESKWVERRPTSKVKSLTSKGERVNRMGATRQRKRPV